MARGAQIRESQAKIDFREQSVQRQNDNGDTLTHRFEIPQEPDSSFPNANQGGVSVAEVALATRQFFQLHRPEKLFEKVKTFMRCQGWELIWTPPYMTSFHQPIELFWAHGKRYSRGPVIATPSGRQEKGRYSGRGRYSSIATSSRYIG